jgi:DNA-binding Lrp family transcriptional regulator
MTIADERILEFLQEEGPHSPSKIQEDDRVQFSRTYINDRCKLLTEHGLTKNLGNGVYAITDKGESYLAGEADLREESTT